MQISCLSHNSLMLILKALLSALVLPVSALAQEHITFPTEDGGVVLAHGGRFTKESWQKQVEVLVHAGFRALAIDFRGRGGSHGPRSKSGDDGFEHDVLAAVRYLGATGAKTVAVVGSSFGGEAAANASIEAELGEIDRLALLAAWTDRAPEKIKGRKPCARRCARRRSAPAQDSCELRKGGGPERVDHPRWLGTRSVSICDKPGRPPDARDPAIPFGTVTFIDGFAWSVVMPKHRECRHC